MCANDTERAMSSYESVFDWEFERYEPSGERYWLAMTGPEDEPGIDGGLMRRPDEMPRVEGAIAFVCTVDVESVDDTLDRVTEHGGSVATEPMHVPGVGWHAYCPDTEGNVFGAMQPEDVPVA